MKGIEGCPPSIPPTKPSPTSTAPPGRGPGGRVLRSVIYTSEIYWLLLLNMAILLWLWGYHNVISSERECHSSQGVNHPSRLERDMVLDKKRDSCGLLCLLLPRGADSWAVMHFKWSLCFILIYICPASLTGERWKEHLLLSFYTALAPPTPTSPTTKILPSPSSARLGTSG